MVNLCLTVPHLALIKGNFKFDCISLNNLNTILFISIWSEDIYFMENLKCQQFVPPCLHCLLWQGFIFSKVIGFKQKVVIIRYLHIALARFLTLFIISKLDSFSWRQFLGSIGHTLRFDSQGSYLLVYFFRLIFFA